MKCGRLAVEPILGPSTATSLEEPRIVLEENQQFADSRKQTSDPSSLPDAGPYDFGALSALIGIRMLSVGDKKKLLEGLHLPVNFNFPLSVEGKQSRRFQQSWFAKYQWLTYSRSRNGGYCAYCLIFPPANTVGSGENIALGVLVITAMTRFKKALEILHLHEKSNYHQTACMKVLDFKDSVAGRRESINKQLDKSMKSQLGCFLSWLP